MTTLTAQDYAKLADEVERATAKHLTVQLVTPARLREITAALRAAEAAMRDAERKNKVLTDLAYAADTAELLLRIMFPDEAASLRDKVTVAKAALTGE